MRMRSLFALGALAGIVSFSAWAADAPKRMMVIQDPAFVRRNVRPEPKAAGIPIYDERNCMGAVVNGVCHGTVIQEERPVRCHGKMIEGECTGLVF